MEYLLNHLNICSMVYHGNTIEAINTLKEVMNQDDWMNCPNNLRVYLSSLNYSIYNYILINEQTSLHRCCLNNNTAIRSCTNSMDALKIGCHIIHSYSICSDYLVEKHTHPQIKKSLYYIHENISTGITLNDVSEHVNLHPHYFCSLFKKHMNCSFNDYVNKKRIQLAKTLIQTCNLSLDLISCKCGFNSYAYFCTTFKKVTGVSPSEYKQKR